MKKTMPSKSPENSLRARSRAPRKEPQPYLSHRPGLSGRVKRIQEWVRAVAA
jgi:hypothetical protein